MEAGPKIDLWKWICEIDLGKWNFKIIYFLIYFYFIFFDFFLALIIFYNNIN